MANERRCDDYATSKDTNDQRLFSPCCLDSADVFDHDDKKGNVGDDIDGREVGPECKLGAQLAMYHATEQKARTLWMQDDEM